jgi:hypothetical protein
MRRLPRAVLAEGPMWRRALASGALIVCESRVEGRSCSFRGCGPVETSRFASTGPGGSPFQISESVAECEDRYHGPNLCANDDQTLLRSSAAVSSSSTAFATARFATVSVASAHRRSRAFSTACASPGSSKNHQNHKYDLTELAVMSPSHAEESVPRAGVRVRHSRSLSAEILAFYNPCCCKRRLGLHWATFTDAASPTRFGGKHAAQSRKSPNGQNPIFATAFATKRTEIRRKSITIHESRRSRKNLILFAFALIQPHQVTTNKPAHNPKVAGSNPAPATKSKSLTGQHLRWPVCFGCDSQYAPN